MEEPVLYDDATEGFGLQQLPTDEVAERCGNSLGQLFDTSTAAIEAVMQHAGVAIEFRAAVIALSGLDDLGGHESGFDGGTYALSALRISEAGGIANQHHAIIDQLAL